jgi:hypothetical protein
VAIAKTSKMKNGGVWKNNAATAVWKSFPKGNQIPMPQERRNSGTQNQNALGGPAIAYPHQTPASISASRNSGKQKRA